MVLRDTHQLTMIVNVWMEMKECALCKHLFQLGYKLKRRLSMKKNTYRDKQLLNIGSMNKRLFR